LHNGAVSSNIGRLPILKSANHGVIVNAVVVLVVVVVVPQNVKRRLEESSVQSMGGIPSIGLQVSFVDHQVGAIVHFILVKIHGNPQ
jgi:hypothetical protein